jgi:hypothetical protein
VATRRDVTVWSILTSALNRQVFGTKLAEHHRLLSATTQLVSREVIRSAEAENHFPNPWFSSSRNMPLERVWRLGGLAFAPCFYDLSTSQRVPAPYTVSPLCAQPVFELCGRIPVDIHFAGGRTRGLARRAFVAEVPEPILRRQWKDRPLSHIAEIVQRNSNFIREVLLDGALTHEGILDRKSVELALRDGPTQSRALSGEILRHLDLELWLRQRL